MTDENESLHPNDSKRREYYAHKIASDIIKEGFSSIEGNLNWIIAHTMKLTKEYGEAEAKRRKSRA